MQVEFITLQPVPDIFDYLPPGGIAAICPSSPISLCHPQCAASLQPLIYIWAHHQTSHGADGLPVPNCQVWYGCGMTPSPQPPKAKL